MIKTRAHSKFSASGAERWFNCSGSVALSEGLPDKSSAAAEEGTRAHAVVEKILKCEISGNDGAEVQEAEELLNNSPKEMAAYGIQAGKFIIDLYQSLPGSGLECERKVFLDFIHPEMFGSFDSAVIDYFDMLYVFDYKWGKHTVSPRHNLQMLFYGIGLAHENNWDFKRVRLYIYQPNVPSFNGEPAYWELSIKELRGYVKHFEEAVERVEASPNKYKEGDWCFFCKARGICPLKQEKKIANIKRIFNNVSVNF